MDSTSSNQPPAVRRRPPWYKRRVLINYRIQLGYALAVAWIIVASILITALSVYHTVGSIAFEPVLHERLNEALARVNQTIFWRLLLLAGIMVAISMILTIYFLHRLVGPAYRIEKVLRSVASGTDDLPTEFRLREKDELKSMGTAIQMVLDTVRKMKEKEGAPGGAGPEAASPGESRETNS